MDAEKRQHIAAHLSALVMSSAMRDETLETLGEFVDGGYGTLLLNVPRSPGKPIDAAVVKGGLAAKFVETKDVL